ncbi:6-phosphogluconolactonase [Pseudaestuariivita rosea]|uniref:6-phosphogluconolactonase n=1 Tax=Pseudaestuariivita rosea TaxID=2763263 RepID=UPI001ABA147B|nr:6-phosphogluconolactonase [Pseudaestuariivita rosea]
MEFIEYPDREMMMIDLGNKLAGEIKNCLLNHEWSSFAVPGGTTPGPVFDVLCAADLDWSRVHIMLTDERWVPEDHERSNTRLLRERLLVDRAADAKYIPLYAKADTPEDVLPELEAVIAPELPLSVVLLGMGADMHTASLFPGADRLQDAMADNAPILMPMRAPGAPEPRVTLTARVLKDAMSKHILITGTEKRAALERARHMSLSDAPVAAILSGAQVHWAE